MTKNRHKPDKSPNNSPMYRPMEWSCAYFDGEWCELIGILKKYLTSCYGIYYSCQKQIIRNNRHECKK